MTSLQAPHRRGSAALLILVGLLLLGGLIAWFVLGDPAPAPGPVGPIVPSTAPGPTAGHDHADHAGPRVEALTDRSSEGAAPRRVGDDPNRFRGRGTLRGSIDTDVGLDMPLAWSLVLEPSASLAGTGSPVARRVEFTAGEQDFVVEDLPLGGYAVRPEAPGCNGRTMHVLLERTADSAYIMLRLSPAGFIEGRLQDDDGLPVEDLAVWLFPGAPRSLGLYGADGRSTTSNVEGLWRFEDVLDGPYTLIFGAPDRPLVDPVGITFVAPSLTWPAPDLPPLLDVELMVTDAYGQPAGDARVRGTSPAPFDVTTPPTGRVVLRNLPHGSLSLVAEHEVFGTKTLTLLLDDPDGDGVAGPYVVGLAERP